MEWSFDDGPSFADNVSEKAISNKALSGKAISNSITSPRKPEFGLEAMESTGKKDFGPNRQRSGILSTSTHFKPTTNKIARRTASLDSLGFIQPPSQQQKQHNHQQPQQNKVKITPGTSLSCNVGPGPGPGQLQLESKSGPSPYSSTGLANISKKQKQTQTKTQLPPRSQGFDPPKFNTPHEKLQPTSSPAKKTTVQKLEISISSGSNENKRYNNYGTTSNQSSGEKNSNIGTRTQNSFNTSENSSSSGSSSSSSSSTGKPRGRPRKMKQESEVIDLMDDEEEVAEGQDEDDGGKMLAYECMSV